MPSLQDALQNALAKAQPAPPPAPTTDPIPSDWDDEGGAQQITETNTKPTEEKTMEHYFKPTTNVSRETFNLIRDTRGLTRSKALRIMTNSGYNSKSVSSLLCQMVAQGMMQEDPDGILTAAQPEYTPVKAYALMMSKRKAKAKAEPRAKAKVEVKEETPAPVNVPALAKPQGAWSPDIVLHGLSVIQSKAVYDELKKYFG